MLQTIKDIPIFAQTIKDLCAKNLGRKRKDPPIIKFGCHVAEIICGKLTKEKYSDPNSPMVTAHIKNIPMANTLID